jgi:hypothetical protein
MPKGESIEFILEKDKLEKIRKVIAHNGGEVVVEAFLNGDVRLKVKKATQAD